MIIAVTGATGAFGRLVLADLSTRVPADHLVAVVRDPDRAADLAAQGIDVRQAPYDDLEALTTAFTGVDQLLFVSGSEVGRRVAQHANVVRAAVGAGVGQVTYTSAPHASDTTLVLAPEHKATEELITGSGLRWTILRNNWYSENYASTLASVTETGRLVGAAGEGRVASAARADYAAGAAAVLTTEGHEGVVYELGGDTAWTYADLAGDLASALGRPVEYVSVSAAELDAELTAAGLDEQTRGFLVALDVNVAEGTLAEVTGQLSTLIRRPTTPLLSTLKGLA